MFKYATECICEITCSVNRESELKEITSVFAEIIHCDIELADLIKKRKRKGRERERVISHVNYIIMCISYM